VDLVGLEHVIDTQLSVDEIAAERAFCQCTL
jgi:hypothetical protein